MCVCVCVGVSVRERQGGGRVLCVCDFLQDRRGRRSRSVDFL